MIALLLTVNHPEKIIFLFALVHFILLFLKGTQDDVHGSSRLHFILRTTLWDRFKSSSTIETNTIFRV